MDGTADRIERLLDAGGMRKDIILLPISAVALILSLFFRDAFPADPAWIAVILCGIPILAEACIGLFTRFDIKADVLVSIALIASLCIGEIFAAGEVAAIMQIGSLLENYTSERASKSTERLIGLRPDTARVIRDGKEITVPVRDVVAGDIVRILAGETVPVDGIIISGTTAVDQSMMTGEPVPADKTAGDSVMSGTVNMFGVFDMTATGVGDGSSLERMIRLVSEADANKARIVRAADRWATWIVAVAMVCAIATFIFTQDIVRTVTVLVVFCPCSLILAAPTAVVAAIGNAGKHGLLVKSGASMERLSYVDTVAFDKTGTVTDGMISVERTMSTSSWSAEDIQRLCAVAEGPSEHPIGRSIASSVDTMEEAEDFVLIPGMGISATVEGRRVIAGNVSLMREHGIVPDRHFNDVLSSNTENGETAVLVSIDDELSGFVVLSDRMKSGVSDTVSRMREMGIGTVMITGDTEAVASAAASSAGIDEVISGCLPADKLRSIGKMQDDGRTVCMVGDGINDAAALRKADVGIAMGGIGSDIAVEAADMILMKDDVNELPFVLSLSRRMMRIIVINIIFSMALNVAATLLAAFGIIDPVSGALIHNAGSVLVVVNSALLLVWKDRRSSDAPLYTKPSLGSA